MEARSGVKGPFTIVFDPVEWVQHRETFQGFVGSEKFNLTGPRPFHFKRRVELVAIPIAEVHVS